MQAVIHQHQYGLRCKLSYATIAFVRFIDVQTAFFMAGACCATGGNWCVARPACDHNLLIPLFMMLLFGDQHPSLVAAIFLHNHHTVYTLQQAIPPWPGRMSMSCNQWSYYVLLLG